MAPESLTDAVTPYIAQVQGEGWCVLEGVIPPADVAAIRDQVETSEADYREFIRRRDKWSRNVIAFMPDAATTPTSPMT